jgi:hypothetical protein
VNAKPPSFRAPPIVFTTITTGMLSDAIHRAQWTRNEVSLKIREQLALRKIFIPPINTVLRK